ncbi:MAG: glycosyl hydrolase [Bacteroidota bacterium]
MQHFQNNTLLKFSLLLFFVMVVKAAQAQPTFKKGQDPKPENTKWVKVENMSDEFKGSELDATKWQKEPVGNDWTWIGRPPALFKAENVKIKDGKMQVTVGKLDDTVRVDNKTFTHQGAIVRSIHPGQVGWYFECKMKANKTVMSSTFWLMTKYNCEKKEELDIQECVGRTTEKTDDWAKEWDHIFHSNAIHRKTECHPESERDEDFVLLKKKNHQRYYVYGAWWKSPEEILFFLNGKYQYTLNPTVTWDVPAYLQMAIETYYWNPIPEDGGLVEHGSKSDRTTKYKWIRTWKLEKE